MPLGRMLKKRLVKVQSMRHTAESLQSVTQESDLNAFLSSAVLADTHFAARRNTTIVYANTPVAVPVDIPLAIPRRPSWQGLLPNEQHLAESAAFLEWRRSMATLEEESSVTPFERNINVWRQLWRVVEQSDLVVQIVDARNPLLFLCNDLSDYVTETIGHDRNLLLVNKADFLSPSQRSVWEKYFLKENIRAVFFSAVNHAILSPADLISVFKSSANPRKDKLVVGMVGYPNVGKSSTINALLMHEDKYRVTVSATPGKTKHFQTLGVGDITLCDCPGLVFPRVATKAEMLVNGILPISQMRDHRGAIGLVTQRVPNEVFEQIYGLKLNNDLLVKFARARGYMRSFHGMEDEARAAREILKDFVSGRLLHVHSPPE